MKANEFQFFFLKNALIKPILYSVFAYNTLGHIYMRLDMNSSLFETSLL